MIKIFYNPKEQTWRQRLTVAKRAIFGSIIEFNLSYEELKKLVEIHQKVEEAKKQKQKQS